MKQLKIGLGCIVLGNLLYLAFLFFPGKETGDFGNFMQSLFWGYPLASIWWALCFRLPMQQKQIRNTRNSPNFCVFRLWGRKQSKRNFGCGASFLGGWGEKCMGLPNKEKKSMRRAAAQSVGFLGKKRESFKRKAVFFQMDGFLIQKKESMQKKHQSGENL